MKVYLARHGRTNYNDLRICNSDPSVDVHLTDVGHQQAAALADKLKDVTFEHVFVSELRRTQQTADIVNKHHGVPVTIDRRLNDNRTGFEGKPTPDYYAALEAAEDKWTIRLNDGESLEDTKQRVKEFLTDLKTAGFDSVMVVTSMTIVQAFYGLVHNLRNQEIWDLAVETGSYFEIEI